MSETYVTYRVWDGCKAPANLEYGGRLIGQIARESTIDRDALLELVDEMETADPEDLHVAIDYVTECASRIREALVVES